MHIIAIVDDSYGMLFNYRRVSRDRYVNEKIIEILAGKKLWLNSFSAEAFEDSNIKLQIDDEVLKNAGECEYVFIEDIQIKKFHDKVESIIIFKWNRRYPSDFKLDYIPGENGMVCVSKIDFAGYSHDKITMEVWKRDEKI